MKKRWQKRKKKVICIDCGEGFYMPPNTDSKAFNCLACAFGYPID